MKIPNHFSYQNYSINSPSLQFAKWPRIELKYKWLCSEGCYSLLRLPTMTFIKSNIRKLWLKRNTNYSAAHATYFHFMISFIRGKHDLHKWSLLSLLLLVRVCVSLSVLELDFKFQLFSISLSLTHSFASLSNYSVSIYIKFFAHFE